MFPSMPQNKSLQSGRSRIPFDTRFWHFVIPEPNTGCWIWMGPLMSNGYGKMGVGYKSEGNKKTKFVHRISYEHFVGKIPEGLDLDHKCRVRCCVNPEHLEPVTRIENIRRGAGCGGRLRKKRKFCIRGHSLDKIKPLKNGRIVCPVCRVICREKANDKIRESRNRKM